MLCRRRAAVLAAWVAALAVCAAEETARPQRNCLWRVGAGTNCVYLQGSIHLLKQEHYPLNEPIRRAFAEADVLVLETDLGAANDPALQAIILAKGALSGESTLEKSLDPDTYRLAGEKTSALGLDIGLFRKFKPWFFALTMTMAKLHALGFSPTDGLDWHLYRLARETGKDIVGLETLEYQMNLFDAISPAEQDMLVRQTLKDFDTVEKEMEEILLAWKTGDGEGLERTLFKHLQEYPKIYQRFVADRNRNWVGQIERFLAAGRTHMIVVGAGHLVGKESLPALLRQKGWKVEQW